MDLFICLLLLFCDGRAGDTMQAADSMLVEQEYTCYSAVARLLCSAWITVVPVI